MIAVQTYVWTNGFVPGLRFSAYWTVWDLADWELSPDCALLWGEARASPARSRRSAGQAREQREGQRPRAESHGSSRGLRRTARTEVPGKEGARPSRGQGACLGLGTGLGWGL